MLTYHVAGVQIKIYKKPGIYIYLPMSATGKSRLSYKIQLLSAVNDNVFSIPSSYVKKSFNDFDVFRSKKELLVFDRFEQYVSDSLVSELQKISDVTVILLETKVTIGHGLMRCHPALLEMTKDLIEVY